MASGAERTLMIWFLAAHFAAIFVSNLTWTERRGAVQKLVDPYVSFSGQRQVFKAVEAPQRSDLRYRLRLSAKGDDGREQTMSGNKLPERLRRLLTELAKPEKRSEDAALVARFAARLAFPDFAAKTVSVVLERAEGPTGAYASMRAFAVGEGAPLEVGGHDASAPAVRP